MTCGNITPIGCGSNAVITAIDCGGNATIAAIVCCNKFEPGFLVDPNGLHPLPPNTPMSVLPDPSRVNTGEDPPPDIPGGTLGFDREPGDLGPRPGGEIPCVDVAMWWPSYVETRDLCSQLTTMGSSNFLYLDDFGGDLFQTLAQVKAEVLASQLYADYLAEGMCEPFEVAIGYKGPVGNSAFDPYDWTFTGVGPDFVTLAELDALIAIGDDAAVEGWFVAFKAPYTKTTTAPSTCP